MEIKKPPIKDIYEIYLKIFAVGRSFLLEAIPRVMISVILDNCLDIIIRYTTFGMHHAVILGNSKHNMLFLPEGFAYGFSALEDTVFIYKCSNNYHKASEGGIKWNDPDQFVDRGVGNPLLSDREVILPILNQFVQYREGGL